MVKLRVKHCFKKYSMNQSSDSNNRVIKTIMHVYIAVATILVASLSFSISRIFVTNN